MRIAFLLLTTAILAACPGWSPIMAATTQKPDPPVEWNAPDQEAAVKRAKEVPEFVSEVLEEYPGLRQQRLQRMGLGIKDVKYRYSWLNSPFVNFERDEYEPVRFMHSKHAALVNDCSRCHHARPAEANASETVRCSACHQEAFKPKFPERLGLKAAYHIQCMGCHEEEKKGPVDCLGCHLKNPVDHSERIALSGDPSPMEVTAECLRCHAKAGEDMLTSAHWLWRGPSPYTLKHGKEVQLGKVENTVNNF